MFYKKVLKPILFSFDPETAHGIALSFLRAADHFPFFKKILSFQYSFSHPALEFKLLGMQFRSPVGLAAGFDKNCELLNSLACFGFGFIEGGTVTALGQEGNPKPRIFRLKKEEALINCLGFNNLGAEKVGDHLKKRANPKIPIGINIGKSKSAALKDAAKDYLFSFEKLYPFANYFTINVSSPNTPRLRELQNDLLPLLSKLQEKNQELSNLMKQNLKPLFVKIAPDLSIADLEQISRICIKAKITGIIAANTTVSREGIENIPTLEGGVSGKLLETKSTQIVRHLYKMVGKELVIIGVGGIFSAEDAYKKIKAGASLVQIYTGWVYQGPCLVQQINQGLVSLLEKDGFKNIQEAVGIEA